MRLYTKISKALWCNSKGDFVTAKIPSMTIWERGPETVYWFDKLFEGGIYLPENNQERNRALTILITGKPGTGKSTLALELCYNWNSTYVLKMVDKNKREMNREGFSSVYITSESDKHWTEKKANSLGLRNRITTEPCEVNNDRAFSDAKVVKIWQTTEFQEYLQEEGIKTGLMPSVLGGIGDLFSKKVNVSPLANAIRGKWEKYLVKNKIKDHNPSILAIDSLNTIENSKRPEVFRRFMSLVDSGPKIILLVVESGANDGSSEFWEYTSDIVIRLDKKKMEDYLVRTIEIVKARYQSHIWGEHQLKIYNPSKHEAIPKPHVSNTDKERQDLIYKAKKIIDTKKRAHPYHTNGGIFIFPSIHYYLSVYKRLSPITQKTFFDPPLDSLTEIFEEGFPRRRCLGFIGTRGGHKSHLGYLTLLRNICNSTNERALIVSLRDDEGMARKTLDKIIENEVDTNYNLEELINNDMLEIMYFPPGYITPEEFFHRMMLSVYRLKDYSLDTNVTVLFNSLDQLSSRFPLCARQQIFIPGMISALSAEGVTSIFIAVEEPGQPPEQYGLLSMADVLISFKKERFKLEDYLGHAEEFLKNDEYLDKNINKKYKLSDTQKVITMRIVRFAGGQAAGAGGILELIHKKKDKSYYYHNNLKMKNKDDYGYREGLIFIPFCSGFSQEECFLE